MKSNMRFSVGLACLFVPLAVAAAPKAPHDCWNPRLDNVPLVWRPTEQISLPKVVTMDPTSGPTVRIEIRALADSRQDRKRIGENREDVEGSGCIWPVRTRDDAAAWTTERLRFLLRHLGFSTVDTDGDVVISGELRQFFVTETHTYDGEVGLKIDVISKDGKALWSGLVGGSNGHWGRSYKLENYHETLSDALIDAVKHLTADASFVRMITVSAAANP